MLAVVNNQLSLSSPRRSLWALRLRLSFSFLSCTSRDISFTIISKSVARLRCLSRVLNTFVTSSFIDVEQRLCSNTSSATLASNADILLTDCSFVVLDVFLQRLKAHSRVQHDSRRENGAGRSGRMVYSRCNRKFSVFHSKCDLQQKILFYKVF